MPGGKPVTAVPGESPRSPPITLGPVLVMALPARTENASAVPRPTLACAAEALDAVSVSVTASVRVSVRPRVRRTAAIPDDEEERMGLMGVAPTG